MSDSRVSIRKFGRVRYWSVTCNEPSGVDNGGKACLLVWRGFGFEGEGDASNVRVFEGRDKRTAREWSDCEGCLYRVCSLDAGKVCVNV